MTGDGTTRCVRAAQRISARGYRMILEAQCETAETPGFPGQIRGVTDHRQRTVRVSLRAHATMEELADTLEHELHHVDDPGWDCGNRDVFGRGH